VSDVKQRTDVDALFADAEPAFPHWEVAKDLVDEMIDLMLDYRQSGHPGGSRSKVHALLATLLSGAMRWDVLRPWRRFSDRFVLSAGHTIPLVYATLAVLNEAFRARQERSDDPRFAFPDDGKWALTWEDLTRLRRRGGLAGHAEMEGKTLFIKFNTGPSGHGMPPAAGEALALKHAGAGEVKVFVLEGEGGLTPGASHETKNTAWGLGLDNLVFLIDWNDFGIDDTPISRVVHGTPRDWFEPYGWKVSGTEQGSEWGPVARSVLEAARGDNPGRVPCMSWHRTRKGRGYLTYDNKSHGAAHKRHDEKFWTLRKAFMEKYGVVYQGVDRPAPADPAELRAEMEANFRAALSVLRSRPEVADYLTDRLTELADAVPDRIDGFRLGGRAAEVFEDSRIFDFEHYPEDLYLEPGVKAPNRAALGTWGAYVNSLARREYGRPLFLACSADLAESTNIAGFMKGRDGVEGWGWYDRDKNPTGALLPQEITEFANAGLCVGAASVNLAENPFETFDGYWTACSTYGSFSYLKYGAMRLFSQLAQDCDLAVGKVLWVAGHSGPETAEDSRTHFGIFATGVTQLFPDGHVIDLHPWEHNEVPVVLAAALRQKAPIVALHLTRPPVEIPDREALGIDHHFTAARGAYVLRRPDPSRPRLGTVFVQGTSTTAGIVKILPELTKAGLNVKIVAAISPQLFALAPPDYRDRVVTQADRWDSMVVSNRARRVMGDWTFNPLAAEYSLTSDQDDRWRTGGALDEVIEEARLDPASLLAGIERFVRERETRLLRLRDGVGSATSE